MGDDDAALPACSANGCGEPATHSFTWPGSDRTSQCAHHAAWAVEVAAALGFRLELSADFVAARLRLLAMERALGRVDGSGM